jgi:hypothetical protein
MPSDFKWGKSSQLALQTIHARVDQYREYIHNANAFFHVPRMVDLMAEILGVADDEAFDIANPMIIRTHIWDWTRIPFSALRKVILGPPEVGIYPNTGPKIDEW